MSCATLIISIIFIIIGIYFGESHYPILRLFFIAVSLFYLPALLLPEIVYSIIPSMCPDMDTMNASQFNFQIGLMFVLGCVYAYLGPVPSYLFIEEKIHYLTLISMITEKRPCISIFKLNKAYYFKHFFDDPELFRKLEPYHEKASYRFKMATAGERNKVMKLMDRKGFDPNIIEDAAPYTVEIGRYQNYGELLKNSVESYPLLDKIVLVIKDMVWVEQALAMDAKKQEHQ